MAKRGTSLSKGWGKRLVFIGLVVSMAVALPIAVMFASAVEATRKLRPRNSITASHPLVIVPPIPSS
jgi:hypothetical protein